VRSSENATRSPTRGEEEAGDKFVAARGAVPPDEIGVKYRVETGGFKEGEGGSMSVFRTLSWEKGGSLSLSFRIKFALFPRPEGSRTAGGLIAKEGDSLSPIAPLSSKFSMTATDCCLCNEGFRKT
jgi:hypothetical protein